MNVILMPDVQDTLTEISDFIDSINVKGAGERWVDRFISSLENFASPSNVTYALCSNQYLASLGLSCINYKDWIVSFKIEKKNLVVYKILRGSILT